MNNRSAATKASLLDFITLRILCIGLLNSL